MEYTCIKFNQISKSKLCLSTKSEIHNLMSIGVIDFAIIDNQDKEFRLYSKEIKDHAFTCKTSNLLSFINSWIENGVEAFIINDHDIELDYIRDNLISLATEKEIFFIINNITEKEIKNRVAVDLTPDILLCSEEEWEKNKENILSDINLVIERQFESDYPDNLINQDDSYNKTALFEFFNIFNSDSSNNANDEDKLLELSFKEKYSYTNNEEFIEIGLTNDDDIIINDSFNSIKISPNQFDFVFNTISKLLNS